MSPDWKAGLLEPISEESPCGVNPEDSGDLAQLELYQIFGQDTLEPPAKVPKREPRKSDRPPNWRELEALTTDILKKSHDLRVLAHLSACVLRSGDLAAFVATLEAASYWLETAWTRVYPLVDEDVILRTNALNALADRVAIIDGLRGLPLITSQVGRFSIRELEPSQAVATDDQPAPDNSAIRAAFASMPIDDLRARHASALAGLEWVAKIEEIVRTQAGVEALPTLDRLTSQLQSIAETLKTGLAGHPDAAPSDAMDAAISGANGAASSGTGSVRSRQDAIRALDAVAEFFRRNEPSSPVPLLVDRAKRLISKDFLEVLEDLAPGALQEAKSAGGIRD